MNERGSLLHLKPNHAWWARVIAYFAVFLQFLLLVLFAWLGSDFNFQEIPESKPLLGLADAAWEKGDVYEARYWYWRAGRIASWRDDWQGVLAAACGMKKIDRENTLRFWFALIAAERRQSRPGISAVASALAAIGAHKAAAMVSARIRTDWPEETDSLSSVHRGDCWEAR